MPFELKKISPRLYEVSNSETGKVHAKHTSLKNAKAQLRLLHMVGGAISGKDIKNLTKASYKENKEKPKKIGNLVLDKELSTRKASVYANPKTGEAVITHRGTKGTASDWANNAVMSVGLYKKTDRYKKGKEAQKAVNEKYGKENVITTSHSQSGQLAHQLNKEGLVNKSVEVNPARLPFQKVKKNEEVIKSSFDPVSVFVPSSKQKGKVTVIKAKSFNPLAQHSPDIIRKKNASKMFGLGELVHVDINSHNGKNYKMEGGAMGDLVHIDIHSHNGKNYKMEGGGFVPHYYQYETLPRRYM
jgi:hypothetical protein